MPGRTEIADGHHERIEPGPEVVLSSDRTFGLVFAAFWTVAGFLPVIHSKPIRWWALAAAGVFLLLALTMPRTLHLLNLLWAKLALLLHHIISPIAMAVVFFLAFTTTGVLLRVFGKDLLRLRAQPGSDTYWIPREPPGPPPESMIQQF